MSNEVTSTITVSRDALYKVLHALVGPAHNIRELQATRILHELGHPNPIDILIEQFKAGGAPAPKPDSSEDARKLATAIANAATRAGITDAGKQDFSGPQLLMLLDDMAEMIERAKVKEG